MIGEPTTIRLDKNTKTKIKEMALVPNETYDHIINRLISENKELKQKTRTIE